MIWSISKHHGICSVFLIFSEETCIGKVKDKLKLLIFFDEFHLFLPNNHPLEYFKPYTCDIY